MKKFVAFLVMTVILCILALNTYYTSDYDYKIPDNTTKISASVFKNNTYVEAIQTFLDGINNHDIEGVMKISYPDKYADTMYILNREETEQLMDIVTEDLSETVTLIDIISEEALGDEEKEMFYDSFVFMQILTDYVEENNIKDNTDFRLTIDDEKRLATTPYCKIKDLYVVDCVLKYENEHGGTFTAEQPFIMMKIAGEGWKTDIEMMDYIMEGRQNAIDLISLNLKLYVDKILDILTEKGVEIPEKCTISSDGSKNSNVSDEFLSIFTEILHAYESVYTYLGYVIEIENGVCINAECSESFITHYPDSSESQDVEHIFTFENDIFKDIYDTYSEKFKKAINKAEEVKELW